MSAPRVELDWEEGLFRGLLAIGRRLAPKRVLLPAGAARLADQRAALAPLAQVIAAEPVRLLEARGVGGTRGRDLLLPATFAVTEDHDENRSLYVIRTAISAAIRRVTRDQEPLRSGPHAALESLRVARVAIEWLCQTYPRFEQMHQEAAQLVLGGRPDPANLRGRERVLEQARQAALRGERPWEDAGSRLELSAEGRRGRASEPVSIWGEWMASLGTPDTAGLPAEREPDRVDSEQAAPAVDELRRVELDPREQEDAVLIHTFEKAEALDSYRGGARDLDGADELEAHQEALEEVELGDLIRCDDTAHSVLQADLQLGLEVPDVGGAEAAGLPYDEWDVRRGVYRRGWCRVVPSLAVERDATWVLDAELRHRRLITELRRKLETHRSGLRPRMRQRDGEDVDIDALVDASGSIRAGAGSDGRLYVRSERRRRDFATTVLLDVSLSTDAWVSNRRVLDVARDAIFVLGEVADQLGDRLQVLAFASHTRKRCHVWQVKDWRETWHDARARLGALEPRGYTRIGPAIRYATDRLAREPAERKLLLLVSDGKPSDYDRYEGRYGIADVRQALREAESRGISAHALAVDAVARDYLPPMFGPGGWHVLPHPDELPAVLSAVYGRLTAR